MYFKCIRFLLGNKNRSTSITNCVFLQWWQSTDLQLSAWAAGIVGGEGGYGAHWCQCQLFTAHLFWPHAAGQPTAWHTGCQPGNLFYKMNINDSMLIYCFVVTCFAHVHFVCYFCKQHLLLFHSTFIVVICLDWTNRLYVMFYPYN